MPDTKHVGAILALALPLALAAGSCKENSGPADVLVVKGQLTSEGIECPAMRDGEGKLYTLTGSLGAFKSGDRVCVKGRVAEVSHCQQGITLVVETIGPEGDCP